jgi:integrase/recombinase XerD
MIRAVRQIPGALLHEDHGPGVRHAFIAATLDADLPMPDFQEAASHADLRTTMRYHRVRTSLDRHRRLHRRGSGAAIPSR